MPTPTELQSWLAEAESALRDIIINGATRRLRHGDKEEWFSPPTVGELRAHIADLKSQLGVTGGRPAARRVLF